MTALRSFPALARTCALLFLTSSLWLPALARAADPVPLGSSITVDISSPRWNRVTGISSVTATLTNAGSEAVQSPLWLELRDLLPVEVTLTNGDGTTPNGAPYVDFSDHLVGDDPTLSPEEVVEGELQFHNPGRAHFTFTPEAWGVLLPSEPLTVEATSDLTAGEAPLTVTLSADVSGGVPTLYEWDFESDGIYDYSNASSATVAHTYSTGTVHSARIRVSDGVRTAEDAIAIHVVPQLVVTAFASPRDGEAPLAVLFSAGTNGPVTLYEWDFEGDGVFEQSDPTSSSGFHTYDVPGIYHPTVRVTNAYRTVTDEIEITVTQPPALPPAAPVIPKGYDTFTTLLSVPISGFAERAEQVEVSGPLGVTVYSAPGGSFSLSIPLHENFMNHLVFTGISGDGVRGGSTAIQVTNDIRAPQVYLDFPADGAEIFAEETDVAGRVSDALSGFNGLRVLVNGQPAAVNIGIGTNGTFFLPGLDLPPKGQMTITAMAEDLLGNSQSVSIQVSRVTVPAGEPTIALVSGQGQTALPIHSVLPEPLTVEVRDGAGDPIVNRKVTFTVTRSDGQMLAPGATEGELTLETLTDANGRASGSWRLGSDAGQGNNRVEVTAEDVLGEVLFCASAQPGPAAQVNIGTGNNQRVEAGGPIQEPFRAWVSDACNGVDQIPVTFTVVQGEGKINGEHATITLPTGPTGHVGIDFVTDPVPGLNLVEAKIGDGPGQTSTFYVYGLERNPDQPTRLDGLVFDNAMQPVGGAPCELIQAGQIVSATTTDLQGQFHFVDVPAGQSRMKVSGQDATHLNGQPIPARTFPTLAYDVLLIPNANNQLPMPVLLPPLNPNNERAYHTDPNLVTILECEGIEGLQMIVQGGSMHHADGTPYPDGTILSVNQVHHDDVPMPMPDGAAPPFAWTLQPGGAHFDPPIKIVYPNMSGLPPGAVAYFLSFDHDTNKFEIVASGTVGTDGAQITSDPGAGLSVSGWGCSCPPYAVTGDCEKCPDAAMCRLSDDLSCEPQAGLRPEDACNCPPFLRPRPSGRGCMPFVCGPGEEEWLPNRYFPAGEGGTTATHRRLLAEAFAWDVIQETNRRYPGGESPEKNAWRHVNWQCRTACSFDPTVAREFGEAHEVTGINTQRNENDTIVDLFNNEVGRKLAGYAAFCLDCNDLATHAVAGTAPGGNNAIKEITDRPYQEILDGIPPPLYCGPTPRQVADRGNLPEPAPGLALLPERLTMDIGSVAQLQLVEIREDGSVVDLSSEVAGAHYLTGSMDDLVVQVSPDGLVRGAGPGRERVFGWAVTNMGDTLSASAEITVASEDDIDGDGVSDNWEVAHGLLSTNPNDALSDTDADSLLSFVEYALNSDPQIRDTDADNRDDFDEAFIFGTSPVSPDVTLSSAFSVAGGGQVATPDNYGAFLLQNVAGIDLNGDLVADDPIRVTGSGTIASQTYYVATDPFLLGLSQRVRIPQVSLGLVPPHVPQSIMIVPDGDPRALTLGGEPVLVRVIATYGDGTTADVTGTTSFTVYRSSNTDVIDIAPDGNAMAAGPGLAFVRASNLGVTAVALFEVVAPNQATTVIGRVEDESGAAVVGADITIAFFDGGALSDDQGGFEVQAVPTGGAEFLIVRASKEIDGVLVSTERLVTPVPGGVTDAGTLVLVESCDYAKWEAGTDTPGLAYAVTREGGFIYVADGKSGLAILEEVPGSAPIYLFGLGLPGEAKSVSVVGNAAFVALGDAGMAVVDVSDPSAPMISEVFDTPGQAASISVRGSVGYVADGAEGLFVVGLSDPMHPVPLGSFSTGGDAVTMQVVGNVGYLANRLGGLAVLNLSDAATPVAVTTLFLPGNTIDLVVSGDRLYVANGEFGIRVIDISSPLVPTLLGSEDSEGFARSVDVYLNYVIIADDAGGVELFDVTDSSDPELLGIVRVPGVAVDVTAGDDCALIAAFTDGVQVLDLSTPRPYASLSVVNTSGSATDVEVEFPLAYVADGSGGLQVVDLENLAAPEVIGTYDSPGQGRRVDVGNGYAYLADGTSGVQVVDLFDSTEPVRVATMSVSGDATGVALSGTNAFVTRRSQGRFYVFNVSNPSFPQIVTSISLAGLCNDVVVSGDYAYVSAGNTGVHVIDINPPNAPVRVATLAVPAESFAVEGDRGYVVTGPTGLTVVDLSNPAQPIVLGALDTPGSSRSVAVTGGNAYVADNETGMQAISVEDATALFLRASGGTGAPCAGVTTDGEFVYAACTSEGLRIFPLVCRGANREAAAVQSQVSPTRPWLQHPTPNPSAGGFRFEWAVDSTREAELAVYDATGRRVRVLADGVAEVGIHRGAWDGQSDRGIRLPAGVYFVRLRVDSETISRKILVVR